MKQLTSFITQPKVMSQMHDHWPPSDIANTFANAEGFSTFPYVGRTILVGKVDNDCFVSPTTTCNSDGTNGCSHPTQPHSLGGQEYPFCTQPGIEGMRLKNKCLNK